jgi:hypothetical protein
MRLPGMNWKGFATRLAYEIASRKIAPGYIANECGITHTSMHSLTMGLGCAGVSIVSYLAVCQWAGINPLEYFRGLPHDPNARRDLSQADGRSAP